MSTRPPSQDPPDDVDELYRRASALDTSRPGESVRRAVLAHAAQLSATRGPPGERSLQIRPAASPARWRGVLFGGLAAAALAALVIAPRIFTPGVPKVSGPPSAGLELQGTPSAAAPPPPETSVRPAPGSASPPAFGVEETLTGGARTDTSRQRGGAAVASSAAKSADSSLAVAPAARSARQPQAYAAPAAPAALAGLDTTQTAEAFRQAAAAGDLSALATLRSKQYDIDARDSSGRTALMLAIVHAQADAVLALLDYGADPNVADARGVTPLEAARGADQPAIVAALLRHGAR